MDRPEIIDLHMHTTVSDGTDAPLEILEKVQKSGIDLFSVTDHDDIRGCVDIQDAIRNAKVEGPVAELPLFLTGVEFSCADEEGKYHILGYAYDPQSPAIRAVVEEGHDIRIRKVKARLAFLKEEFGFTFSEEDIQQLFALNNPGKPHIGNMMVRYGYAPTRNEAIHTYIDKLHLHSSHLCPETAIRGILDAGGIPVLAHPAYGDGDQIVLGEDMERRLRRLIGFGLRGLEAFYSGFSEKIILEMLAFAEQFALLVTAGSDYHGKNKMIHLGETNLSSVSEGPEALREFLRIARQKKGQ